jgi:hypothetical protein
MDEIGISGETGLTGEALLASLGIKERGKKSKELEAVFAKIDASKDINKTAEIVSKYAEALHKAGLFKTNKTMTASAIQRRKMAGQHREEEDSKYMEISGLFRSHRDSEAYFFDLNGNVYRGGIHRINGKGNRVIIKGSVSKLENPLIVAIYSKEAIRTIKDTYLTSKKTNPAS